MTYLAYAGWILCGYLSGSLVWGFWISRVFYGIDIRGHGSGNIGATNVYRVLGPIPGAATLILDVAKGYLPIFLAGRFSGDAVSSAFLLATGLAVIAGHTFPIFRGWKGGKAVNTSFGVMLALFPNAALCAFLVWITFFFLTGYVSIGSIISAAALPVFIRIFHGRPIFVAAGLTIAAVIIWAHRGNIRRLVRGNENRIRLWKK